MLGLEKPFLQTCRMDKVGVVEGEETLRKTCVVRGEKMRAWSKWESKFMAMKPRAWIYKKITLERKGYKSSTSLKLVPWTLTSMAQFVKRCSPKPKVTGLIPGQGTGRGCRFSPWFWACARPTHWSLSFTTCFFPSLSPFLPLSLKSN